MQFRNLLWLLTAELAVASRPIVRYSKHADNRPDNYWVTSTSLNAFNVHAFNANAAPGAVICATGQAVKYTVQRQDTLNRIAQSLGSGVCDIASANGLVGPNLDVIFPNQTLTVPVALAKPDSKSCIVPPANATCVVGGPGTAVVKAGDAFVTIAASLGISPASLLAANPGVDRFNLAVGQVINVPVCTGDASVETPAAANGTVAVPAAPAAPAKPPARRGLAPVRARAWSGASSLFKLTKGETSD